MLRPVYAKVRELPEPIQRVLEKLGYGRKDISIRPCERVSRTGASGDGYKRFVAVVDLGTGQSKIEWGSWGGANMFNPQNAVDLDRTPYSIPPNVVVIDGHIGGDRPVSASLNVRPDAIAPLLPAASDVSEREKSILQQFAGLKPSYRKEQWARNAKSAPSEDELNALASRGLLKRAKNGATSITTEGRNAIAGERW